MISAPDPGAVTTSTSCSRSRLGASHKTSAREATTRSHQATSMPRMCNEHATLRHYHMTYTLRPATLRRESLQSCARHVRLVTAHPSCSLRCKPRTLPAMHATAQVATKLPSGHVTHLSRPLRISSQQHLHAAELRYPERQPYAELLQLDWYSSAITFIITIKGYVCYYMWLIGYCHQ